METTIETSKPKTRTRFSLARLFRIIAIAIVILIPVAYIAISVIVADKSSHRRVRP